VLRKLLNFLKEIHYNEVGGTGTAVSTGDVITAAKMNLKLEAIVDADLTHDSGDWTIGEDGAGQDIIYYTDTASRVMTWDPSDSSLELDDNVIIAFGSADDVEVKWDAAKLLWLPVTDDTGIFQIGDGTHSMDFKWYGDAATKTVSFDVGDNEVIFDDVDLNLGDNDYLIFGDGADVVISWDEAKLLIMPATDDTGRIQVGDGTTGMDVKFLGAAAGTYLLWDMSNESLDIVSAMAVATGTTSEDVLKITVTDASTISGNINRGLYIDYTTSGAKTGTAQVNCIGYDLTVTQNCPDVMLQAGYLATIADKTISLLFGISLYFEDFGNAIGEFCMLDLGYNSPHAPSGRNAFMRLRQHHTVQAESAVMLLEGNSAAGYFIKADTVANLIESGDITDGKACTHGVRCKVGSTVFVLAGYED